MLRDWKKSELTDRCYSAICVMREFLRCVCFVEMMSTYYVSPKLYIVAMRAASTEAVEHQRKRKGGGLNSQPISNIAMSKFVCVLNINPTSSPSMGQVHAHNTRLGLAYKKVKTLSRPDF